MKLFICTAAFALTTIFSFANEKTKINLDNPKSDSQLIKGNNIFVVTLSYDVDNFCEGKNGVSTPKVSIAGGVFSYTRESNGTGGLAFNTRTGKIDHSASDRGIYKITYQKGQASASTLIVINECN